MKKDKFLNYRSRIRTFPNWSENISVFIRAYQFRSKPFQTGPETFEQVRNFPEKCGPKTSHLNNIAGNGSSIMLYICITNSPFYGFIIFYICRTNSISWYTLPVYYCITKWHLNNYSLSAFRFLLWIMKWTWPLPKNCFTNENWPFGGGISVNKNIT